ncbi:MAG TPA: hypothetical protein PLP33_14495 [Leptospiraceae bacterium]|nr:hypothetical protein [Leptospiraceae bacterium]
MLYDVQLKLGKILGRYESCTRKKPYYTLKFAEQAVKRHNDCPHMSHKVDLYSCGFCGNFHIGRTWHVDDIRLLFTAELTENEKEYYMPLLET